jgi:hypothetical protein
VRHGRRGEAIEVAERAARFLVFFFLAFALPGFGFVLQPAITQDLGDRFFGFSLGLASGSFDRTHGDDLQMKPDRNQ